MELHIPHKVYNKYCRTLSKSTLAYCMRALTAATVNTNIYVFNN